jgi:hypothetical protein
MPSGQSWHGRQAGWNPEQSRSAWAGTRRSCRTVSAWRYTRWSAAPCRMVNAVGALHNAIGAGSLQVFVQGTDDVGHGGLSNWCLPSRAFGPASASQLDLRRPLALIDPEAIDRAEREVPGPDVLPPVPTLIKLVRPAWSFDEREGVAQVGW